MKTLVFWLSGIDGSGKTMQARKLSTYLTKRKIKVSCIRFGASIRFFTFPFYLFFKLMNYVPKYEKGVHTSRYPLLYKRRSLHNLWFFLILLDMVVLAWIRAYPKKLRFDILILDRSPLDVIVELILSSHNPEFHKSIKATILYNLVKPDLVLVFDVPETVAFSRKKDIPNLDFIKVRRALYRKLAPYFNATLIDANKPVVDIRNQLIKITDHFIRESENRENI
jgi:dTMP kinase